MRTATLHVGSYSSSCSTCNRNAFPEETHHYTVSYGHEEYRGTRADGTEWVVAAEQGEPGCGAEFTAISSAYLDPLSIGATRRLRPDLPFADPRLEVDRSGG